MYCCCTCSPEVSLCTYNVPHPSKHCINVRIQTKGAAAIDILQQGLEDLSNICDHIMDVFQVSARLANCNVFIYSLERN